MDFQINRQYELVVGDAEVGLGLVVDSLQIAFDISKSSSNADKTNSASIELYNLSPESLALIDVDYPLAHFKAGYRDIGLKELFFGRVTNVTTRRSGTDTVTQIQMGAAYTELNHQVLSSITPPGRTVRDVAEDIRKTIPGVSRGVYNGTNLNNPILYGYPIQGTPKQVLTDLSRKYGLEWQIDGDVLYIHDKARANNENFEEAYLVSEGSGLIDRAYRVSGDPRRSAKDEAKIQGVQWKMLLNPDIVCGSIVELEDRDLSGWYKVTDLRHYGDYRGNDWYTEVRAVALEKVSKT